MAKRQQFVRDGYRLELQPGIHYKVDGSYKLTIEREIGPSAWEQITACDSTEIDALIDVLKTGSEMATKSAQKDRGSRRR